jgi:deoxyribose-phosphate aldolase
MSYLEKYEWTVDEAAMTVALQERAAEVPLLRTPEIWKRCFGLIDLTTLNATDTEEKVRKMAEKVNSFPTHFKDIPNVAAMCVYPSLAQTASRALSNPAIQVAAVGGGFPSAQTFLRVKCEECRMAVEQGATEIDIVISLGAFLAGDYTTVAEEIMQIKAAIGKAHLKVILETGVLLPAQIATAAFIAMESGADFIKTSTGKLEPAATPAAAWIMTNCIRKFYEKTGRKTGFKPAGGLVSPDDALMYYAIVKSILGEEWITPSLFRFGASRLANNLLTGITGTTVTYL